jgi:hypothetical protein
MDFCSSKLECKFKKELSGEDRSISGGIWGYCASKEPCELHIPQQCDPQSIGLKYDRDKPRWDLLPLNPVKDIVDVLTFGAAKYGPNNWRHVDNAHERYYAALMRHIVAYRGGEINDPESGLPHLAHAMCCLVFLSEL